MRILTFQSEPVLEVPFLNAGRGPGRFYEDRLPIHIGTVDRLPTGVDAILLTGDLQGRETFQQAGNSPPRLLGEVLPRRLNEKILPRLELPPCSRIGAFLAGDFYTVPALDKRGGTGDVTSVWQAFGDHFAWVVGVAGNHDTFGSSPADPAGLANHLHYLDGTRLNLADMKIAGIGGIIGNPSRVRRRSEDDYLNCLESLLEPRTDILIMHDGPDSPATRGRGSTRIREVIKERRPQLVIRGHAHWKHPFAELAGGVQVVNVDARVVVLT